VILGFQANPKDSKTNSNQLQFLNPFLRIKWKQGLTAPPASIQACLNFEVFENKHLWFIN